ncbi:TPA: hypothetical protein ACG0AR_000437 [Elizabethkingia anophelis]
MQIIIHTKDGDALFKAINAKIRKGDLKTWEIKLNKENQVLYNHSPEQWSEKVLLIPKDHINGLKIQTTYWSNKPEPDQATKGYIVGRFVEILMVHFKNHFSKLEVS